MPAAATHSRNFIKGTMVGKANNYELLWRFKVEILSPAPVPVLHMVWLTAASQLFQIARFVNFL